jgi:hypothetical protein
MQAFHHQFELSPPELESSEDDVTGGPLQACHSQAGGITNAGPPALDSCGRTGDSEPNFRLTRDVGTTSCLDRPNDSTVAGYNPVIRIQLCE